MSSGGPIGRGQRWLAWPATQRRTALAVALALAAFGVAGTSRVQFEAGYAALLSKDSPAVTELTAVKRELGGGTSELVLVVTGTTDAIDAVATDLAGALSSHPDIARADAEMPGRWLAERALYLVERTELDELVAGVDAALTRSVASRLPGGGGARDDDAWSPVVEWRDRIQTRYARDLPGFGGAVSASSSSAEQGARGHRYVFVRPRVSSTELDRARSIVDDIHRTAENVRAASPFGAMVSIDYGGRLAVHLAEQACTQQDLRRATLLALVIIVLVLVVALRRITAPILIAVPLVLSLVLTLAVAGITLGGLNLISAFTLPALAGLGVDYGIHLYTAFLRELRPRERGETEHDDRAGAMQRAVFGTIGASAASAATTAAAFGSLVLVDFRGFAEFGVLGASGVVITLVTTYLVLPPLAVMITRRGDAPAPRDGNGSSRTIARVTRTTRPAAAIALAAAAVTALLAFNAPGIRFVNDFDRLKSTSEAIEATEQIERQLGRMLSPTVFVVPDLDAARTLDTIAGAARRARDPRAPVGVAHTASAARLVPADAEDRSIVASRMRDRLVAAREHADLEPGTPRARALDQLIAFASARPYGLADVPESIRARLVGADSGTFLVFVWPDDRLYLDTTMRAWLAVVDQLRDTLASSIGAERAAAVRVLDERRVPLEVVDVIGRDLPRALALAGALVLLVLFALFRRVVPVLLVAGTMVAAMAWLFGVLVVTGLHINVYSAVVIPCIVGIGIDNAIHIHHAYDRGGPGSLGTVLATTGVAATLASLTTGIGFGAAMSARQGGLVSMGTTAVIGIACALVATTVLLPAVLRLHEAQRARRSTPSG